MKKTALAILIILLFVSCRKHEDTNNGNPQIIIKGTIPLAVSMKSDALKSGSSFTLSEAKKVLVSTGLRYSLADITNGSFTASADMGSASALIFLDGNNKYIGNLFAGGLNMLPLSNLKDDEKTSIDLQSLTLDSTNIIPAHDPIGDEINLNAEEISRMKELGGYFESLAKNIDADNDGTPDILSNRQLRISSHFSIYGGSWGTDTKAPSAVDTSKLYINYHVRIEGNISMAPANDNTVVLSGPVDDPYNNIVKQRFTADKDCFISFFQRQSDSQLFSPFGTAFLPFKKGTYNFTLDGNQIFTLNYSNIDAKFYMVVATPTIHTASDGTITSVSLEYHLPDNTPVEPKNFITVLQLQFNDKANNHYSIGALYESVKSNQTITDFKNVPVTFSLSITNLQSLSVNYNDLLGNEYDASWHEVNALDGI